MPIARFQFPDGRIGRFEVPEGTTPEQAQAMIGQYVAEQSAPQDVDETPRNIRGEPIGKSSTLERAFQQTANVATGASGLMRGAANLASRPFIDAGERGLGDVIWPRASKGTVGEIVGSLLDPAALAIGGGVAKAIPYAPMLGRGAVQGAQALGQNLAGGAIAGGAIGGLSESGTMPEGAGIGAAANVVIPPIFTGVAQKIAALKDRIYPTAGALGVRAAGDKADDVIRALQTTKSGVPGVNLTAGQASVPANSAEFAALQELVAKRGAPSRYFGPGGIEGEQELARLAAVRGVGGTPETLKAAIAERSKTSAVNYGEAFSETVSRDAGLRQLWKNPYFRDELMEAWKLAKAEGISPRKNLTEFLHFVKLGLDARLQEFTRPGAPAISEATKRAVSGAKDRLVQWIATKNPTYDLARAEHAAMSVPIDRMKMGQEIERALVAPATGAERPASVGAAIRAAGEKVSKATGKPRIEALTSDDRQLLGSLLDDFKRDVAYTDLARAGRENLVERVGKEQLPPTGLFQPMLSAARSWVNKFLGTGHEAALNRAAPVFENPQELAKQMRGATVEQRAVMAEMLSRLLASSVVSEESARQ